jgi:hypothetical protein
LSGLRCQSFGPRRSCIPNPFLSLDHIAFASSWCLSWGRKKSIPLKTLATSSPLRTACTFSSAAWNYPSRVQPRNKRSTENRGGNMSKAGVSQYGRCVIYMLFSLKDAADAKTASILPNRGPQFWAPRSSSDLAAEGDRSSCAWNAQPEPSCRSPTVRCGCPGS